MTKTTRDLLDTNGNVTGSISGYAQYDIAGNVVETIDPRSTTTNIIATTFDFSDRFGTPDDEARGNTQAPAELGLLHTYAFATLVTNPLGHTAYTQYDYYLGKPVNGEDTNGIVAKGRYDDLLDRPTEVDVGIFTGSQLQRRTLFTYSDASHLITTQSDQTTLNDGVLTSTVVYDGLGRTTETRTAAPEGTIYTNQEYDGMGRVKRSYNPYRATSDETYGYTDTAYDALGRVTTVTTPDNAVVTTTYSGNATTVTDQAGKQRRSLTDGLGRLIRVDEPDSSGSLGTVAAPTQPTSYLYDVLDDLVTVTQGGQTRFFMYDSLKRLTRARNPEQDINANMALSDPLTGNSQWSVGYIYDSNSNLSQKTDARGIVTNYTYDALNRLSTRSYQNDPSATPGVTYSYDSASVLYSKGRLTSVSTSVSSYDYLEYDALGRIKQSRQTTVVGQASQSYTMGYGYNLAGEMTSETYPSGRVVQTEYDTAGRVAGVKNQGAGWYYAGATTSDATNRIQYAAQGAVSAMKLGNGKWEHTTFNNRLQPTQIGLGISSTDSSVLKLDYTYGATGNNGNVLTQTITEPGLTLTQCYGYDSLNRLSTAEEHSGIDCTGIQQWKQAFSYDRYGNRSFDVVNTTGNVLGPNPTTSQSTNRFAAGQNYGYDAAGNLTSDPATNANGTVYDAENRQTQYTRSGQGTNYYYYDGDGRRVEKIDNTGTTVFVYNVAGQLIAEYTSGPASGGGTSYLTSDHLGSTRVVTDANGGVKARHDYLPFGEEIQAGMGGRTAGSGYIADNVRQKFTQKERDSESGLDYFGARYYSSAQGRFTSADPVMMKKERRLDPQRLNLYCYARNNPLKYIDPDGADILLAQGLKPKQREFLVKNLARLYMTQKGREILERADKSPYNIEIGKGELERKRVGPPVAPGTTVIGGTEHVVGGLTSYDTFTDKKTKEKYLAASGPSGTESFNPITVKVDKDNTSDMGKDPATVLAHELGGHVANVLNLAERPDPNNPEGRPEAKITGLDAKADEESSKEAEKVGKLPDKPTPEATKAVEELLKKRQ